MPDIMKQYIQAMELLDEANVPKIDDAGELTLPERIEQLISLSEYVREGKTYKRPEKLCSEK